MPETTTIRRLGDGVDRDGLAQLLEATFTSWSDGAERVEQWAADGSLGVFVAQVEEQTVGFLIVRATPVGEPPTMGDPFGVSLADAAPHGRWGTLHTLAVAEEHRRRGLANALVAAAAPWLIGQGCSAFAGICWDHGNHGGMGSSGPMFEAAGFTEAGRSNTLYQQLHASTGGHCERCTPEPCSCPAILYVRVGPPAAP